MAFFASKAELQLGTFRAQAALAVELQKALVIHARLTTPQNEAMFLSELKQRPEQHVMSTKGRLDGRR